MLQGLECEASIQARKWFYTYILVLPGIERQSNFPMWLTFCHFCIFQEFFEINLVLEQTSVVEFWFYELLLLFATGSVTTAPVHTNAIHMLDCAHILILNSIFIDAPTFLIIVIGFS